MAEEPPIIPPDAAVEIVSTGDYQFTEGPALAPDGSIYFSDIPNDSIHRYDPATGETTLFTDDSGGANGLMFSINGEFLVACSGKSRELRYYPSSQNGADSTEAGEWAGLDPAAQSEFTFGKIESVPFNSPNDLAISQDAIYFTDPRYGNRDSMELPHESVYVLTMKPVADEPNTFQVTIEKLIDDLVRPNGIGISPDEQTLYVNDNGDEKIWAYPILKPGEVGEGRLLNDLADLGGPDGMTVGPLGRIYTTIYGKGVLILSPEGERLGFLETGPQTTNCVFGADGKTLYVTAEKSLKRVVLSTGVAQSD